ncbi:hypothetical protein [Streptomyces lunaelactis]|uniref:hypothetical protein n=1 Tax=Streptomyces lunaelactis TaxID=1535768 RepID=UPI0015855AB6|nr:hypothetical protein [Streptomyces lunaelactis]NUK01525.1 hypothetical protein [Streptomyces lunaelactis]NUK20340.1 hypothetical protein [Streptomyces lunaelactis]
MSGTAGSNMPPHDVVSPETLRWQRAAEALEPEHTLGRIAANAKFVLTSITLLGAALSAAGLVSITRLMHRPELLWLAVCAFVLSLGAVLLSLLALVLRSREVNLEDLEDVEAWYKEEFGHAVWVTVAGWLLCGGILAAGVAAVVAAVLATPSYQVALQSSGSGGKHSLTASAAATDAGRGSVLIVSVTGTDASGAETVLIRSSSTADTDGAAKIKASVDTDRTYASYKIVLTDDDKQKATLTVPAP